jgi:hypothetical protein
MRKKALSQALTQINMYLFASILFMLIVWGFIHLQEPLYAYFGMILTLGSRLSIIYMILLMITVVTAVVEMIRSRQFYTGVIVFSLVSGSSVVVIGLYFSAIRFLYIQ